MLRHSRNPEPHYHKGKKRCGEKSLPQGCVENKEIIGGREGKTKNPPQGEKREKGLHIYSFSLIITLF
jgi:hypothetical protein